MDNVFDFNAPQYVDFLTANTENDHHVESYFDIDHEVQGIHIEDGIEFHEEVVECTEEVEFKTEQFMTSLHEQSSEDQLFFSPMQTPYKHAYNLRSHGRKSVSVNDLTDLINQVEQTEIEETDDIEVYIAETAVTEQKPSEANYYFSAGTNLNKNKSKSRNNLQLGKNKFGSMDHLLRKTQCQLTQNKFISNAEALRKFQLETPIRFRSKPNGHQKQPTKVDAKAIIATVAESPKLHTKLRHRTQHVLSREELETLELEELKKHPVKANPIKKKILQHPDSLPAVAKKTATKLDPFRFPNDPIKLKKAPLIKDTVVKFHAKPMPNFVKGPVKPLPTVVPIMATVAQTPKFSSRFTQKGRWRSSDNISVKSDSSAASCSSKPLTRTKVEPFSFEERHQLLVKKKEDRIKQVFEEEKKLRTFHANPLPKWKTPSKPIRTTLAMKKRSSSVPRRTASVNDENKEPQAFKARPAKVLYKKPFQPVLPDNHLIDVTEFHLNSERRAHEREEFERNLKEKEMRCAMLQMQREEEQKKKEQQFVSDMRKTAVHKANPIRKYKELPPPVPLSCTIAESPNFVCEKRLREKHLQE